MKKMLLLGIAAVALIAAVPVQAALTLDGQTGIARVPTADVAAPMSLGVAAEYVFSDDTFIPARVGFGVIDGLEVGAHYWYLDTEGVDNIWGVNAKYRLPFAVAEGLGLAVGAGYQTISADIDDVTTLKFYGTASYDVKLEGFSLQPTLGVSWERVDFGDTDDNGFRVFGGIVAMVMPNLGVGAEFISSNEDLDGDDADASVWFGARFVPIENLTVQAGMINNANVGGDAEDYVFHVGAQYNFSFAQ